MSRGRWRDRPAALDDHGNVTLAPGVQILVEHITVLGAWMECMEDNIIEIAARKANRSFEAVWIQARSSCGECEEDLLGRVPEGDKRPLLEFGKDILRSVWEERRDLEWPSSDA